MKKQLFVVGMFLAAYYIGFNMFKSFDTAKAAPMITARPVPEEVNVPQELSNFITVDVNYNLETGEVDIKRSNDADVIVNVTTTGEYKPEVKYVTKTVKDGYPLIQSMRKIGNMEPISPVQVITNGRR